MNDFFLGVGASLTAALIGVIIVHIKTKSLSNWKVFKLFWNITFRIRFSGITNFFGNRTDYAKYRKEPSISEYISTTNKEFIYIGFWLAHGIEFENITRTFERLLNNGCSIEVILINPDETVNINKIANYMGLSVENITNRINNAFEVFVNLKKTLPDILSNKFTIRFHTELITSSTFIFDYNSPKAKTLVDFKLFGGGRDTSFGFELKPTTDPDSLYERLTNSFLDIRRQSSIYQIETNKG